jgi:hypothetical protein
LPRNAGSPSTIGGNGRSAPHDSWMTGRRRREHGAAGPRFALAGVGERGSASSAAGRPPYTRVRKLEDQRLNAYRELTDMGTSVRDAPGSGGRARRK